MSKGALCEVIAGLLCKFDILVFENRIDRTVTREKCLELLKIVFGVKITQRFLVGRFFRFLLHRGSIRAFRLSRLERGVYFVLFEFIGVLFCNCLDLGLFRLILHFWWLGLYFTVFL